MQAGLEWIGGGDGGDGGDWSGRRGLEEIPTRSSFRNSADTRPQGYKLAGATGYKIETISCTG